MAKYDVTPELAETIKAVRIQNHVAAKSVAEHIGKSQSYMSKLEKGDIKTIQEEELTKIFRFVFGGDKGFQDFLNSALGTIFDTLEIRFSNEEIAEQIWLDNYDTVYRLIPLPDELVDSLNTRLRAVGLSNAELCDRINANEGISPKVKNTDQYPFNEWQAFVVNHKIEFTFIKMSVTVSDIDKILNRMTRAANYVTVLAMAYYITKTERFGSTICISDDDERIVMREARDYLSSHRFYSIAIKNRLSRQVQSNAERYELLSSFDKENVTLVNEVLEFIRIFSEIDIVNVNRQLTALVNNLKWDGGFMMRLLSTSFSDMDITSFTIKKQMLLEIQAVAERFNELPAEQKRIETYE